MIRRLRTGARGLAAVALAAGCSEELGPERFETARVAGVVTEGGRPVVKGWIEFHPTDGTVGNLRSAPIGPDGTFAADGVAVGVNRIGIAGAPIKVAEVRRFFDPLGSPVKRTIEKAPSRPIRVDVIEEYLQRAAPLPSGAGR